MIRLTGVMFITMKNQVCNKANKNLFLKEKYLFTKFR